MDFCVLLLAHARSPTLHAAPVHPCSRLNNLKTKIESSLRLRLSASLAFSRISILGQRAAASGRAPPASFEFQIQFDL